MQVFVVQHVHVGSDGASDVKLIGVYASEADAREAIDSLSKQPGFAEQASGFSLNSRALNATLWTGGFGADAPTSDAPGEEEEAQEQEIDSDDLTELFRLLGASQPEEWSASQIEQGIPQLHRFLFLRQAWKSIVTEEDTSWIGAAIAATALAPNAPYAGVGAALASLRAKGATDDELTDLVRGVQAELLFQFCYLLDDPEIDEEEAADVTWGLFAVDEDGTPLEPLVGLHESVLETDPTGREMRPRGNERV
jgi:hypothetical protein